MKRIAVISDLSGLGRCSLAAALPVLSVMGLDCCPLPTALLTNQTEYASYRSWDCTDKLDLFIAEWKKLGARFDAVLTGYLASAAQTEKIFDFLRVFRREDTLFVCDPVLGGEDGVLYDARGGTLCAAVKGLCAEADILTPNLTELGILTGVPYSELHGGGQEKIIQAAKSLLSGRTRAVIVTGVRREKQIFNFVVEKERADCVGSEAIGGSYSGTGDLFAAVVCGELVRGGTPVSAVRLAVRFLSKAVGEASREDADPNDGVHFQKFLRLLL